MSGTQSNRPHRCPLFSMHSNRYCAPGSDRLYPDADHPHSSHPSRPLCLKQMSAECCRSSASMFRPPQLPLRRTLRGILSQPDHLLLSHSSCKHHHQRKFPEDPSTPPQSDLPRSAGPSFHPPVPPFRSLRLSGISCGDSR